MRALAPEVNRVLPSGCYLRRIWIEHIRRSVSIDPWVVPVSGPSPKRSPGSPPVPPAPTPAPTETKAPSAAAPTPSPAGPAPTAVPAPATMPPIPVIPMPSRTAGHGGTVYRRGHVCTTGGSRRAKGVPLAVGDWRMIHRRQRMAACLGCRSSRSGSCGSGATHVASITRRKLMPSRRRIARAVALPRPGMPCCRTVRTSITAARACIGPTTAVAAS